MASWIEKQTPPTMNPPHSDPAGMRADEAALWGRLLQPEGVELATDAARALLQINFGADDRDRMHQLALKNQSGALTAEEEAELDSYCRVGYLLDLWHSKARRSLKSHAPST